MTDCVPANIAVAIFDLQAEFNKCLGIVNLTNLQEKVA
jgi:hypothetical protein